LFENQAWDLFSTLDIVDERSLVRLLDRGGVRELATCQKPPTVEEFLNGQRFLQSPQVVQALSRRLKQEKL